MVMWRTARVPVVPCATEFFPVTTTRGLALSAYTSVPIVDDAYIYQAKVVSGATVIRRWDWDTFANETTAYTPTQTLPATLLSIAVGSVTADASHIYWTEHEETTDPVDGLDAHAIHYYEQRVMKADHAFGSITTLIADATTITGTPHADPFTYGQLVRSPTDGNLVMAYRQNVSGTNHNKFDLIDSSSGARTNIRDSTSALFAGAVEARMVFTPDGALWGQDAFNEHYWRMVAGTFTDLGNPFSPNDAAITLIPTPGNKILTGAFDSDSGDYIDQYLIDSAGVATVAACDYGTVLRDARRFVAWSPDVSVIGFGGIRDGGSGSTPADHHFYRWG